MGSSSAVALASTSVLSDMGAELEEAGETGIAEVEEDMVSSGLAMAEIEQQKALTADHASEDALRCSVLQNKRYWRQFRSAANVLSSIRPPECHQATVTHLWRTRMTSLYQFWRSNECPERIKQDAVQRLIYTDELQTARNSANDAEIS
eukprot:3750256-Amphidinium_carterae.1